MRSKKAKTDFSTRPRRGDDVMATSVTPTPNWEGLNHGCSALDGEVSHACPECGQTNIARTDGLATWVHYRCARCHYEDNLEFHIVLTEEEPIQ